MRQLALIVFFLFSYTAYGQTYDPNLLNKYEHFFTGSMVLTFDEFAIVGFGTDGSMINGHTPSHIRFGKTSSNAYYQFVSWDFEGSTNDGYADETYLLKMNKWHRVHLNNNKFSYFMPKTNHQDVIINDQGTVLQSMHGNHDEVYMMTTCPPISSLFDDGGTIKWTHDLHNLTTIQYEIYRSSTWDPSSGFVKIATVTNSLAYATPIPGYYKVRTKMDNKYSSFSNSIFVGDFYKTAGNDTIDTSSDELFSYELFDNYPNPFNPTTTINYQLKDGGFVSLKVYDILGREVAELVSENKDTGFHSINFDASKLTSGLYIYRMTVNNYVETKRMLLTK